ncbi:MAG: hypothetical protein A2X48_22910 [Lentisphaerae bacterium GWF2_49_21]|nr:MAG: hypothetical protein A2X48_22910 [Lentisphaerae bacterium GWF2_49_21]
MFFSSCDQGTSDDIRHPVFKKGRNKKEDGKFAESAKAFEDYLKINPYSAKCHLELASLYSDNLDDPLVAIYHFRKYLEMEPDSPDRKKIETWIQAAEKEYYTQLKSRYPDDETKKQLEILKEREKRYILHLTRLRNENEYLKSQLGQKLNTQIFTEQPPAAENVAVKPAPASVSDSTPKKKEIPEFYVVRNGDTLSRISKEMYGDIKYYKLIFEANKDTLSSENLQIGQKLRIPKLPEKPQE